MFVSVLVVLCRVFMCFYALCAVFAVFCCVVLCVCQVEFAFIPVAEADPMLLIAKATSILLVVDVASIPLVADVAPILLVANVANSLLACKRCIHFVGCRLCIHVVGCRRCFHFVGCRRCFHSVGRRRCFHVVGCRHRFHAVGCTRCFYFVGCRRCLHFSFCWLHNRGAHQCLQEHLAGALKSGRPWHCGAGARRYCVQRLRPAGQALGPISGMKARAAPSPGPPLRWQNPVGLGTGKRECH